MFSTDDQTNNQKEQRSLQVRLPKKTKNSSFKQQDPMQEAIAKFDQFIEQNKKDEIAANEVHQTLMERYPEYKENHEERVRLQENYRKTKVNSEIENYGFSDYKVLDFFIFNILSDKNSGIPASQQRFIPKIFLNHISNLIKNDPEIKQDGELLKKYKTLENELKTITDSTNNYPRRQIEDDFEHNLINKETAVSEIEKALSQEAENILRSIQKNDQHLVQFHVPGHAVLIEFEKEKDDSGSFNGKYTIRIFNSGDGLDNHQNYIEFSSEDKKDAGKRKWDTCFTVSNINEEDLKKEDLEYLLNFSVVSKLRPNPTTKESMLSFVVEKLSSINQVYSFFKERGKEETAIIHPSQSPQKKAGNCTTRCFNALLHERLSGPGEYAYLMRTLLQNLGESNQMSRDLMKTLTKRIEKYTVKQQIASHQKKYIENEDMPLVEGSERFKNQDIEKMLKSVKSEMLYYQKDSGNLFLIKKRSGSKKPIAYFLKFSPEQENPKAEQLNKFFAKRWLTLPQFG